VKLTVVVPDNLHRAIKVAAASHGDTITNIVVDAFHRYLAENNLWSKWDIVLEQARQLREAQRARRGTWQGPDIAELVQEGRIERSEQISHALSNS